MKKATAFVGSAHKQNTCKAIVQFLNNLKALGDIEHEIVTRSDYKLGVCQGCRICFDKAEAFCPLRDDRDVLMAKIDVSDGVIFATLIYTFHMSGIMKTFLDRFGLAVHRSRYFGKAFTSIVTQGFMSGGDITKNLVMVGQQLGFNILKSSCITGLIPYTEKDQTLAAHSKRFYATLTRPTDPVPSLFMLIGFKMSWTSIPKELDERGQDYRYYAVKGWFESGYFYSTRFGLLKSTAGKLFDRMAPTVRSLIGS
jgi:multimeric flavodoxin WrbA